MPPVPNGPGTALLVVRSNLSRTALYRTPERIIHRADSASLSVLQIDSESLFAGSFVSGSVEQARLRALIRRHVSPVAFLRAARGIFKQVPVGVNQDGGF
jgi:hypothetical protein